ncbi:sensor of ECF-type sigma factor [Dokdonia ponticola]|uniref:Sensor of ECF-type sigma factor n=1 Tax=Dokdonia ponticola TaxID=2041041 RepID=A0ABV9I1V0_9FLAO
MKKIILILTLAISTIAIAQRPNREQLKSLKVAFITEQLDLSVKEAQQFWPVYNTYEDGMETLRRDERKLLGGLKNTFDQLSEKEGEIALNSLSKIAQDKLNMRTRLISQLKNVISSKKILKLLKTEEDFKRVLIDKIKARRGNMGRRINGGR